MIAKDEIVKFLQEHSCYYPFEWINSYKHLLSMQEQVPISKETKEEYLAIFKYAKEQCELLLTNHPNSKYANDWEEGIEKLNEILVLM